ncbi:MAG: conserved hypothetical secreted protein [Marmoricola sp.]|nr:conserved hypothetical secreted protein [Marmoricola sp.]
MSAQPVFLDPTDQSVGQLLQRGISGPITMLNLLRFRDWADYSDFPEAAPPNSISGRDAYDRYISHTMPFLTATGGSVSFLGAGGNNLVGPPEERWDLVMAVRQASVQDFLAFATNEAYLAGVCHRTAALEDSRLLPLVELEFP